MKSGKLPCSNDWSAFQKCGTIVVKGKIVDIVDDLEGEKRVPPLDNYYTVILKPKDPPTYYMKFKTKQELDALFFTKDEEVVVEGEWHKFFRNDKIKNILLDAKRVSNTC